MGEQLFFLVLLWDLADKKKSHSLLRTPQSDVTFDPRNTLAVRQQC